MKAAMVKARPGHRIRLAKINPDDTGRITKDKALDRFIELREKVSRYRRDCMPNTSAVC
jgi:hypothetical protein